MTRKTLGASSMSLTEATKLNVFGASCVASELAIPAARSLFFEPGHKLFAVAAKRRLLKDPGLELVACVVMMSQRNVKPHVSIEWIAEVACYRLERSTDGGIPDTSFEGGETGAPPSEFISVLS